MVESVLGVEEHSHVPHQGPENRGLLEILGVFSSELPVDLNMPCDETKSLCEELFVELSLPSDPEIFLNDIVAEGLVSEEVLLVLRFESFEEFLGLLVLLDDFVQQFVFR